MHKRLKSDPQDGGFAKSTALPYTQDKFREFCAGLFQHRSLALIIARLSTAVFTSRAVTWMGDNGFGHSIGMSNQFISSSKQIMHLSSYGILIYRIFEVYNCKSDTESLPQGDDIILSTTCFVDRPIIFAVMYGCNEDVIDTTMQWLRRCQKAVFHSLVLPMIFAELERRRLFNAIDVRSTALEDRILDLGKRANRANRAESTQPNRRRTHQAQTTTQSDCEAIRLAQSMNSLVNGLQSFQEQLTLMRDHLQTRPSSETVVNADHETDQVNTQEHRIYIEAKLQEMMLEFRSKIRRCEALVETMALVTQMVRATHISLCSCSLRADCYSRN